MSIISKNLYFLRRKSARTQADTAFALKVRPNTISNWENSISEPSASHILAICQLFDTNPTDFLLVDIENGNLIPKNEENLESKKGNLNGNPIGNLILELEQFHDAAQHINEGQHPRDSPILYELRRIAENAEQTRLLVLQLLECAHKKSAD